MEIVRKTFRDEYVTPVNSELTVLKLIRHVTYYEKFDALDADDIT
jgi:hypothetical protein